MNDDETNESNAEGEKVDTSVTENKEAVEATEETKTLYQKTNDATERLEKANSKTEELLNRQEKLYENQKLGGRTMAGGEPEKPKEETPKEYADKIMRGDIK